MSRFNPDLGAVGMFRFVSVDEAGRMTARSVPVGYQQARGMAARARVLRAKGASDDTISGALKLETGQIANLFRAIAKADAARGSGKGDGKTPVYGLTDEARGGDR